MKFKIKETFRNSEGEIVNIIIANPKGVKFPDKIKLDHKSFEY